MYKYNLTLMFDLIGQGTLTKFVKRRALARSVTTDDSKVQPLQALHMDGWPVENPDDRYEAMLDRLETISGEFADSRQFEELTRNQREEAPAVVEFLGELLFGYETVTVEECNGVSLETVCTRVYPTKISAGADHFHAVAPVVSALFRFLDDRGYHPEGDALAARVEGLGDEIVETSANPDNWGMAKSSVMGRPGEVQADDEHPGDARSGGARSGGALHEGAVPGDAGNLTGQPKQEFPIDGVTDEELAAVEEAIDSLSPEKRGALDAMTRAIVEAGRSPDLDLEAAFDSVDVTSGEYRAAMDEALGTLLDSDVTESPGDAKDPTVLDPGQAERFLELYGRLLLYVNERFDVVPGLETYEELRIAYLEEIRPILNRLFHEADTAGIITEFVAENPADLPESDISQTEQWLAYEAGQFAVVEHRGADTVFLDPERPRAFGVSAVHEPFSEAFPTESGLRETLSAIMPEGAEDHPYVYHHDP